MLRLTVTAALVAVLLAGIGCLALVSPTWAAFPLGVGALCFCGCIFDWLHALYRVPTC